jgi:hypothetical protein
MITLRLADTYGCVLSMAMNHGRSGSEVVLVEGRSATDDIPTQCRKVPEPNLGYYGPVRKRICSLAVSLHLPLPSASILHQGVVNAEDELARC